MSAALDRIAACVPPAVLESLAAVIEGMNADALDLRWRLVLGHNMAVAGGLCRSFELGRDLQHVLTNADWKEQRWETERERAEAMREYFHPGCGRPA